MLRFAWIWEKEIALDPSITDSEKGRGCRRWSTMFELPFCDEQSQHWSFPGNRVTHRMTACCSSTRLGLPLPGSALPLASKARNRARSLQFTRTDIQARWSASSSAWKWYVLLSGIETRTALFAYREGRMLDRAEYQRRHLQLMRSKPRLSSGTNLIWQVNRFTLVGGLFSSAWQISR